MDTNSNTKSNYLKILVKKQQAKGKKREKLKKDKARMKELYDAKEWYTIRAILGNQWANWWIIVGARERGKTWSVQDFVLNSFFNPKSKLYKVPFY